MDHVTHPYSFADISIFLAINQQYYAISRNTDIDYIQIHKF